MIVSVKNRNYFRCSSGPSGHGSGCDIAGYVEILSPSISNGSMRVENLLPWIVEGCRCRGMSFQWERGLLHATKTFLLRGSLSGSPGRGFILPTGKLATRLSKKKKTQISEKISINLLNERSWSYTGSMNHKRIVTHAATHAVHAE